MISEEWPAIETKMPRYYFSIVQMSRIEPEITPTTDLPVHETKSLEADRN